MARLDREETGLLVVDMQERLLPKVQQNSEVVNKCLKMIQGAKILGLPVVATEQYPEGLGHTLPQIEDHLEQKPYPKTTFSSVAEEEIRANLTKKNWIIIGIEAHVCVLQTAKDLQEMGKQVVVLNDAISSRSIFDYSTAIAEIRDLGIRVSSVETVLFELVHDSKDPSFKKISELVKCVDCSCFCG